MCAMECSCCCCSHNNIIHKRGCSRRYCYRYSYLSWRGRPLTVQTRTSTNPPSRQVEGLRVTVWVDRIHCLPWAGGCQMTAGVSAKCVPCTLVYRCYIQKAPLSISLVCSPWGDQCRPRSHRLKKQRLASKAEVCVTAKSTPRLDLH